jgi:hypothetical protein
MWRWAFVARVGIVQHMASDGLGPVERSWSAIYYFIRLKNTSVVARDRPEGELTDHIVSQKDCSLEVSHNTVQRPNHGYAGTMGESQLTSRRHQALSCIYSYANKYRDLPAEQFNNE